ncbi:MAG TPA: hypothetical protein VFB68_16315 [Xanthobacteraceae bacterium]|nr:hypothetical protein [Xanthobacteraceae bacterium]
MSSSNEPPSGPAGQTGGRRPPTIDLKATEVPDETAKADEAASAAPRRHPAIAWLPPDVPWPLVAAGAGGAALTLAVLALAGVFSSRDSGTPVADTRLARVEQQLRELAAKPQPVARDARAIDDLSGRVARLETVAATPRSPITDPALANRIATLEGDLKALAERTGVLGRRNDDIAAAAGEARTRADTATAAIAELKGELKKVQAPAAPAVNPAEVEALATRVAALERAAKAMEAQLAGRSGGDGADRSLRLVVVASTLNAAVERGAPFAPELAAARGAAPDAKGLAALEPFAKSGVPTAAVLTRELKELIPSVAKAVGTSSRESGILDRLKASAEKVVRVRRIDEAPGDDPVAIVRRIEIRAEQGNLNGVLAEIAKLPEPVRVLTKEWVARAEGRNAAVEASRQFAAGALAAIGKPSL